MKIELHIHTDQSVDASLKIEQIEDYLTKSKVDALAICDHDQAIPESLINNPCIIPGIEFSSNRGEIIGLFISKTIKSTSASTIIRHIKHLHGLVMIPHPFRKKDAKWHNLAGKIDLFEIYNPRINRMANEAALNFALSHHLVKVVGSDAHLPLELGSAILEIKGDNLTLKQIKQALKTGNFQINNLLYTEKSSIYKSKLLKHWRQKRISNLTTQLFRFILAEVSELPINYTIPGFNNDLIQENLDRRYHYGLTWFWRLHHRQRLDRIFRILKQLPLNKTQKALDAGCGRGVFAQFLNENKRKVFAIDFSLTEIFWAKYYSDKNIKFLEGSLEKLPFKNNSFDLVVCSEVIEHLDHPAKGVSEIRRVLKPGGYALISLPNALSYYWLRCKLLVILANAMGRNLNEMSRHTKWPVWKINQLFAKNSFEKIRSSGTYLILGEPLILKLIIKYFPNLAGILCQADQILSNLPLLKNFNAFYITLVRKPQ